MGSEEAGIKDGYPLKLYSEDSLTREQEYRTFCWGLSEQNQLTSRNTWKRPKQNVWGEAASIKGGLPTETLPWGQLHLGGKKIGLFVGA